ncbi:class I SAM-dependent methyltransferase [Mycobacterium sp. ITM-2016-00317]|uniref:class I SAM-dependent methyltransferase n=1 Tax=Mycobacterium sp. ITM-2016-00317 TaxID=2099694 RepID=UPI00287FE8F6|nr:class I SAM-dependent methyltransferase [Mycobacterium sp. ITM-2016-00317]WNG87169.1 class I SAM-dependent methyltransferase [Mycobacterium sp. ITM-2016-00317]
MAEVMDWDGVYRGEGGFEGEPPWNSGEPQPELAALWRDGKFRSEVLDAGCGHAELSLALAADGYTVTGVDVSPTAISAATAAAAERGLSERASFVAADITALTGFDGRFSTVVDSTLFHSMPVESRDAYLRSVHRAAAPGAGFFVLVFARGAFPAEMEGGPNEVTELELRDAVSQYWTIDDIRPALIHTNVPKLPGMPPPPLDMLDERGRMRIQAFLLSAHKDS